MLAMVFIKAFQNDYEIASLPNRFDLHVSIPVTKLRSKNVNMKLLSVIAICFLLLVNFSIGVPLKEQNYADIVRKNCTFNSNFQIGDGGGIHVRFNFNE